MNVFYPLGRRFSGNSDFMYKLVDSKWMCKAPERGLADDGSGAEGGGAARPAGMA